MNVFQKLQRRFLNEKGHEVPDPTPKAIPLGFHKPLTLQQQIEMLRSKQLADFVSAAGYETEEEANDFDVDDEDEHLPISRHELEFDERGEREFAQFLAAGRVKAQKVVDEKRRRLPPKGNSAAKQREPVSAGPEGPENTAKMARQPEAGEL